MNRLDKGAKLLRFVRRNSPLLGKLRHNLCPENFSIKYEDPEDEIVEINEDVVPRRSARCGKPSKKIIEIKKERLDGAMQKIFHSKVALKKLSNEFISEQTRRGMRRSLRIEHSKEAAEDGEKLPGDVYAFIDENIATRSSSYIEYARNRKTPDSNNKSGEAGNSTQAFSKYMSIKKVRRCRLWKSKVTNLNFF